MNPRVKGLPIPGIGLPERVMTAGEVGDNATW